MEINETQAEHSTSKVNWLVKMSNGRSAIERLFEKLSLMYGSKWKSQFGSEKELESWMIGWAEELDNRNVTFDEAKRGIDKCVDIYADWPPSFPQFLEACRPSLDYEESFYEAVEQMRKRNDGNDVWTNPAIYWAAVELGGDIMSNPYLNIKVRWKTALDKAINEVKINPMLQEIPRRAVALPSPKRQGREHSEAAKRELAKCYEILNSEPKWKRELMEKGRTIDEKIPGLKHASEYAPMASKSNGVLLND